MNAEGYAYEAYVMRCRGVPVKEIAKKFSRTEQSIRTRTLQMFACEEKHAAIIKKYPRKIINMLSEIAS